MLEAQHGDLLLIGEGGEIDDLGEGLNDDEANMIRKALG